MRSRLLLAAAVTVAVSACTDSSVLSPTGDPLDDGPSFFIADGDNAGPVEGFWFLPPLAKQVTTEGVLDENLQARIRMDVCDVGDVPPSAEVGTDPATIDCVSDQNGEIVVVEFGPGSAVLNPGLNYEFSWDTNGSETTPLNPDRFYRIRIFLDDLLLGYFDVNPQNPAPDTPGEDFDDLYAFRLGETLPVKVFVTPQARCALGTDPYVVQCVAQGVIDGNGGTVTLEPIPDWPTTISTVVPAGALPPGYPTVTLTMERIDPGQFLIDEGVECIPGLPGVPAFDAPQFGDCLRVSTDPVLPVELEAAALIEICVQFLPGDYPSIKFGEEQDTRLQIIRFGDDGETQGLSNVDATTCGAQLPSPAQFGFFPVPQDEGLLRTAAVAANTFARWIGPEPVMAHGDIRLAGATTEFSRFRWGLPGQMTKEAGDGVIIQQLEDGSESYDVTATVKVVDAGSPDLSLPPSTIELATVHFAGAAGVSPADVTTAGDGLATTTWSVPQSAGVHTMTATALGLLDASVPVHTNVIDFQAESVTFSATVVGPPQTPTQSPPSQPPFEGLPGETILVPLTITVVDANGEPVSGWDVTWTTSCSATDPLLCDGFVSNDTDGDPSNDDGSHLVTDENGQATGYWTLSTIPGENTLVVTVGDQTFTFPGTTTNVAANWTAFGGCAVTVDGNQATVEGEWDCALAAGDFAAFTANVSGGDAPAEVRWQFDDENIYFLVLVERSALDKVNSLRIDFDNTGDGTSADDDAIGYDADEAKPLDEHLGERCLNRSQSGCGVADTRNGGTMDVTAEALNDGTYTVYELSHPLNGGDPNDIMLESGNPFGFYLTLRVGNGAQGNTQFPDFRVYQPAVAR